MTIIVGSTRGPKVRAVTRFILEFGNLISKEPIDVVTMESHSGVRETPLEREEIMRGARNRVQYLLAAKASPAADYYIGLEGGFEIMKVPAEASRPLVVLENWAYVSNGSVGYFGSGGSIEVPNPIASEVVDKGRSLAEVIDEYAGRHDIRSGEGTWGVLTAGRLSREEVFYRAVVNAFAPFYGSSRPTVHSNE